MKTKSNPSLRGGAVALFALLPLASIASETTATANQEQSSAPQTHVLFTGANVGIFYDGKLYPVEDVEGTALSITVKSKNLGVPIAGHAKQIMVTPVQTIADRSAAVTNFKYERAYTAATDPSRKTSEDMQNAMAIADKARRLQEQVRREPEKIAVFRGGGVKLVDNQLRGQLENQLRMTESTISGPLGVTGIAGSMAEAQAQELFDALEAEFELSSQSPIMNAYVVVLANYHTKENPKDSQIWLAAKSVGLIDSTRHKVWLHEGGLPPGFILEKVHLHVYDHGTEIATDQSENQASLTRDEAHEYLVIDHTSTHKADTLPARLVLTKLPEDWHTHPRDDGFRKTYYVKVDKTGRTAGIFEDEACITKVAGSYYEAVLRAQVFLPALEKGNPVDSVVRMKLGKLSL